MQEIGRIKLVQIQRSSLKQGQRPHRYYDPAPLLNVERLLLTPDGVVGLAAGGEQLIDVHHAAHPESKNRSRSNGISVGFTSHYRAMRDQYGTHLADGCAGENILVEVDRSFTLEALGQQLLIQSADGSLAVLADLIVAAPCVEFSHFANIGAEPLMSDELRSTLQFLDGGMRGFYARLAGEQGGVEVGVGDRVFVRPVRAGASADHGEAAR
jgi:hypothetical protein